MGYLNKGLSGGGQLLRCPKINTPTCSASTEVQSETIPSRADYLACKIPVSKFPRSVYHLKMGR